MLSFSSAEISAWLASFLWPLARIAALLGMAPVFGNMGIPRRVKVAFAFGVTILLMPLVGAVPAVDPWSGAGLAIMAQQIMIGFAMGLAARLVFTMVDIAGELIGLQMGLGFATFFDPQHGTHTPVVAQFLGLLATLVFLSLNGHLMLLSVLVESFRMLPLGAGMSGGVSWLAFADWGGKVFVAGMMLALPVVTILLITNIAIGILTRAAPQVNFFAIGFPITILVGWVMLGLSLPALEPVLLRAFEEGLQRMSEPLVATNPR